MVRLEEKDIAVLKGGGNNSLSYGVCGIAELSALQMFKHDIF